MNLVRFTYLDVDTAAHKHPGEFVYRISMEGMVYRAKEETMNRQLLITLMRIAFVVLFLALVETARAENPHSHPEHASQYANSAR